MLMNKLPSAVLSLLGQEFISHVEKMEFLVDGFEECQEVDGRKSKEESDDSTFAVAAKRLSS